MSEILPWVKAGLAVFSTIVTEAILTPAQAEAMAAVLAEMECDPAPCRMVAEYTEAFEPRYPKARVTYTADKLQGLFIGAFRPDTLGHFQRAFEMFARVPAVELAVFETVCRRHSAQVRRDSEAEALQEHRRIALVRQCAKVKREAADALRSLLAHLAAAGIRSREIPVAERLPAFKAALERGDLPELEVAILADYGIRGERLERLLEFVRTRVEIEDVPTTFEEYARRMIGVLRWNEEMEHCDCAAADTTS